MLELTCKLSPTIPGMCPIPKPHVAGAMISHSPGELATLLKSVDLTLPKRTPLSEESPSRSPGQTLAPKQLPPPVDHPHPLPIPLRPPSHSKRTLKNRGDPLTWRTSHRRCVCLPRLKEPLGPRCSRLRSVPGSPLASRSTPRRLHPRKVRLRAPRDGGQASPRRPGTGDTRPAGWARAPRRRRLARAPPAARSRQEPPAPAEASAGPPPAAPGPRAGPASRAPAPASRPRPYLPDAVQGVHEALGLHSM